MDNTITNEQLSLENFIDYLFTSSLDEKFKYRKNIIFTMKRFGKNALLTELAKQGVKKNNLVETIMLAKLTRDILDAKNNA